MPPTGARKGQHCGNLVKGYFDGGNWEGFSYICSCSNNQNILVMHALMINSVVEPNPWGYFSLLNPCCNLLLDWAGGISNSSSFLRYEIDTCSNFMIKNFWSKGYLRKIVFGLCYKIWWKTCLILYSLLLIRKAKNLDLFINSYLSF